MLVDCSLSSFFPASSRPKVGGLQSHAPPLVDSTSFADPCNGLSCSPPVADPELPSWGLGVSLLPGLNHPSQDGDSGSLLPQRLLSIPLPLFLPSLYGIIRVPGLTSNSQDLTRLLIPPGCGLGPSAVIDILVYHFFSPLMMGVGHLTLKNIRPSPSFQPGHRTG